MSSLCFRAYLNLTSLSFRSPSFACEPTPLYLSTFLMSTVSLIEGPRLLLQLGQCRKTRKVLPSDASFSPLVLSMKFSAQDRQKLKEQCCVGHCRGCERSYFDSSSPHRGHSVSSYEHISEINYPSVNSRCDSSRSWSFWIVSILDGWSP